MNRRFPLFHLLQKLANKNLSEANTFMNDNAKNEGIVVVEKDKLQYKVEKAGQGAIVEDHFSPGFAGIGKATAGEGTAVFKG